MATIASATERNVVNIVMSSQRSPKMKSAFAPIPQVTANWQWPSSLALVAPVIQGILEDQRRWRFGLAASILSMIQENRIQVRTAMMSSVLQMMPLPDIKLGISEITASQVELPLGSFQSFAYSSAFAAVKQSAGVSVSTVNIASPAARGGLRIVEQPHTKPHAGKPPVHLLLLVLIWLILLCGPVAELKLPPKVVTLLSTEVGTLAVALAITQIMNQKRK